jgi:asparagine synthetase B (glutamine-hydrolysing)
MDEYIFYRRSLIIDELNQFVIVTVQAHLLNDVRVGGFFSGCINSSTITALMAQQSASIVL